MTIGRHRPRRGGARAQLESGRAAQLAFYGSTPAYLPVLELPRLRRPAPRAQPPVEARAGGPRWPALIDDELIETIAVVGDARHDRAADPRPARRHRRGGEPRQQPGPRPGPLRRGRRRPQAVGVIQTSSRRGPWAHEHGHFLVGARGRRAGPRRRGRGTRRARRGPRGGRGCAGADVRAAAEREVAARVGAVEAERVGVVVAPSRRGWPTRGRTRPCRRGASARRAARSPARSCACRNWIGGSWRSDSSTAVGDERAVGAQRREERGVGARRVYSRLAMRWRVVSLPEMNRNTSCVRTSTSVRRWPSTSVCRRRVTKSSGGVAAARRRSARRGSRRTRGARRRGPRRARCGSVVGYVPCTTSSDHVGPAGGSPPAARRGGAR